MIYWVRTVGQTAILWDACPAPSVVASPPSAPLSPPVPPAQPPLPVPLPPKMVFRSPASHQGNIGSIRTLQIQWSLEVAAHRAGLQDARTHDPGPSTHRVGVGAARNEFAAMPLYSTFSCAGSKGRSPHYVTQLRAERRSRSRVYDSEASPFILKGLQ